MDYVTRQELDKLTFKMVGKTHSYDKCQLSCDECPLNYQHNKRDMSCHGFTEWYPDEALSVTLNYLKTHEDQYPDLRS